MLQSRSYTRLHPVVIDIVYLKWLLLSINQLQYSSSQVVFEVGSAAAASPDVCYHSNVAQFFLMDPSQAIYVIYYYNFI